LVLIEVFKLATVSVLFGGFGIRRLTCAVCLLCVTGFRLGLIPDPDSV